MSTIHREQEPAARPETEREREGGYGAEVFAARAVDFRYPGADGLALAGVDMAVTAGSLYAVLGPNGSGKSTLFKLLLGVMAPSVGEVHHMGRPAAAWQRRELARRVGVVPQVEETAFPLAVRDLVAMGRYPHLGAWRREGREDRAAIAEAMDRCDISPLATRPFATLSGGERQRARIARALAQRPSALVLDEPTASLDVRHEMGIFNLLRELTQDGVTVALVTHNLNLAARYAQRILLLDAGRVAGEGPPATVLSRGTLERVYRWPVTVTAHPGPGPDAGAPQIVPLAGDEWDSDAR